MRRNILIILGVILVSWGLTWLMAVTPPPTSSKTSAALATNDHKTIPEFSFKDRAGKTHDITGYKDKIVLLNFWASWCAPCFEEFPKLLELAQAYPNDIVLVALTTDNNPQAIVPFFGRLDWDSIHRLELPNVVIGFDPDRTISADMFQTLLFPETFVIDRGLVRSRKLIGADWDVAEMKKILQTLIDDHK